ncbi:VanZ family protein [Marinagarivorans algicola]|uniref:VanZ family protein n=1 Tax=Marinagarivorans algicola TaxID=1513270 RepID=UPI0006B9E6A9|nr:VanZ family protein [Marinagarivorans algicola]
MVGFIVRGGSLRLVLKVLLLVFLCATPLWIYIPASTPFLEALNNSAHAALFFMMGLGIAVTFELPRPCQKSLFVWFIFVFLLVCVGIAIELVQSFIGRSATLSDVLLDALGIGAALCTYWALSIRGCWRILLCGVALLLLTIAFVGPAQALWVGAQLKQQLPVVCNFDSACPNLDSSDGGTLDVINLDASNIGSSSKQRSIVWRTNDSLVLRVGYRAGTFPGGGFDRVIVSWQGYNALCTEVYWPYLSAGQLGVHIHDQDFSKTRKKFDRTYSLEAGANKVCIDLAEVAKFIDLAGVKTLMYYSIRPTAAGEFYLDNIHLR